MSQTIAYNGATLTTVRPDSIRVTEVAENGDAGVGVATIDDSAGSVAIVGLKPWTITQSSAPSGNRRLWTGVVWDRRTRRGEFPVGAGREIEVNLYDLNEKLGWHVITGTDGNRGAESISATLTWLLGSTYVDFADKGLIVYPTQSVDATDYRGQTGGDVVATLAILAGYNYFLYYDEATDATALFFDDSKTSTAFSTSTKISNVAADVDSSTVFAPLMDAEHGTTPEHLASGMYTPYARGAVYRTNAATAAAFASRDQVAPNANVKTASAATSLADQLLGQDDAETDRITCSIRTKAANVNDIRAGHRMQVKFSHFTGYTSYTYVRVMKRTVSQPLNTDFDYQIDLELAPMTPTITCDDPGNTNVNAGATVTGYTSATNPGTHTFFAAPATPSAMNDANLATTSVSSGTLIDPPLDGPYYVGWHSDLGSSKTVACMDYYDGSDHIGTSPVPDTIEYSTDNSTWHAVVFTTLPNTPSLGYRRWVFTATHAARYWRITQRIINLHDRVFGFGFWPGITGDEWKINGQ